MDVFSYNPLPDAGTWIRVLVLEHGLGDDPLRAIIMQEPLYERPEYDAISYCWGSAATPREIQIRQGEIDYSLRITESLYLALRRFRSPEEDCLLWTDAICINQTNFEEKGCQVRLMDRIYTDARKVLIYLGEPNSNEMTTDAMKLMEKIYKAVKRSPADDGRTPAQWIAENKLPSVEKCWKWLPLKMFFRRPWFRRKWIIQECVLACQPVFYMGEWEKDWEYMCTVSKAINDKALGVNDYTESVNWEEADQLTQGLAQFQNVALLRRVLPSNAWKPHLMSLVNMFEASRASDPRDHLFALLSLAPDADDAALNPRYTGDQTVLRICLTYARYFLRTQGSLEVLYRAGLRGQELLAPSWIPDWYGGHEGAGFECNNGIWDPLQRPTFYDVAHGTRPSFVDAGEDTVLGLKGTRIDIVKELANADVRRGRTLFDKDALIAQKRRHLEQSELIVSRLDEYPTGEELSDVQWRTLICNVTHTLEKAPNSYRFAYEAFRRYVLIGEEHNKTDRDPEARELFRKAIDRHNPDKIFGLTDSGYVGMFPPLAREGDVIVAFDGGEFPFVLRESESERGNILDYELVGQCYIHGIMEWEKRQLDLNDSQFKRQDFFLGRMFLQNIKDPARYKQAVRAMRCFRSFQTRTYPHQNHQNRRPTTSI